MSSHHLEQDAAEIKLLLDETQAYFSCSKSPEVSTGLSTPAPAPVDFHQAFDRLRSVQTTLKDLLEQIHSELEEKPPLTREEALRRIQTMWRLRKARKQLKALVRDVYSSFVDPVSGKTYYYNTKTQTTQWTKPRALGGDELSVATTSKKKEMPVFASRDDLEEFSARRIQGMAQAHAARRHLRRLISSVYEKIWDDSTHRFYYHNTRTREVKWVKPRWVSDADIPTPRSRIDAAADAIQKRPRELTIDEAATMVQRTYRRRLGFRRLLELCRSVYERIYDPEQDAYYYHNTRTKEVTWEKPLLLRGAKVDVYTPRSRQQRAESVLLSAMGRSSARTPREWTPESAATRLQGLFRARKARRTLAASLEQRYRKAVDPESGQVYYVDTTTMAVSWEPPALMRRANVELAEY